jgi:hypothetical protein
LILATITLVDVIALLVFISAPSAGTVRSYFVREDSLIENLTAGLYFCAFASALILLTNRRIRNRKSCTWLTALSALGLVGFLDEISFGERLFNFDMPVVRETKLDAVHDVVELGLSLTIGLETDQKQLVMLFLLSGLALSLVAILKYVKRFWKSVITDRYFPLYLVGFIFVLLGCAALMLDTGRFPFRGFNAVEECLELNAALTLLTACFMIYKLETQKPCS